MYNNAAQQSKGQLAADGMQNCFTAYLPLARVLILFKIGPSSQ